MQTHTPVQSYPIAALYFVRSDTNPNLFYTVGQVDGRCACGQRIAGLLHCQCADHVNRARDCKHVKRVLAGQALPATPKVKAAPGHTLPIDSFYGDAGAAVTRSLAAQRQAVAS